MKFLKFETRLDSKGRLTMPSSILGKGEKRRKLEVFLAEDAYGCVLVYFQPPQEKVVELRMVRGGGNNGYRLTIPKKIRDSAVSFINGRNVTLVYNFGQRRLELWPGPKEEEV